jgi:branched-subunit amino acid aminotransferase/4-amino-4-deoxychorismate lyase
MCIPGGLGAHKWADRRTVEGLHGPIVDTDGAVLEATWANVVLVEGDRLVTPRADGRLLPGVTRERLLERGGEEDEVDLARLRAADAVLLTSSVALVTPVGEAAAPVADRLRAELSAAFAPSATAAPAAGPGGSPAPGR